MLGPLRSFKIPMNIPAWRSTTARWGYGRRRTRSGRTASLRISEEETSPKESNHGGWSKCPRNRDELATSLGSARRILIMGTIVELQVATHNLQTKTKNLPEVACPLKDKF